MIGPKRSVELSLLSSRRQFVPFGQVSTDIMMVLYKYLHVVFMPPIYSHDFSISFNQAIFESVCVRERKGSPYDYVHSDVFWCFFLPLLLLLKMGFCSIFSTYSSPNDFFMLIEFCFFPRYSLFKCMCVCIVCESFFFWLRA